MPRRLGVKLRTSYPPQTHYTGYVVVIIKMLAKYLNWENILKGAILEEKFKEKHFLYFSSIAIESKVTSKKHGNFFGLQFSQIKTN